MHRNRRGPRVTNASKMDKGYTWPPDGRRRHALLCLSLSLSLSLPLLTPSVYPFLIRPLSFSFSPSPVLPVQIGLVFLPEMYTPAPHRHACTTQRTCAPVPRVVNAHGLLAAMPLVWRIETESGRDRTRKGGRERERGEATTQLKHS